MLPLIPLFAVIFPFILWPIEILLPYPYIFEEIAMMLLVIPVLKENRKDQIKTAVIIGILFSVSEAVLYLFNISLVGNLQTFLVRILITSSLHIITPIIILIPTFINKKLIVLGFILAVLIHYFFNMVVAGYGGRV